MSQLRQAIAIAEHGDEGRALSLTQDLLAEHPNFEPALKFQGALLEDLGNGIRVHRLLPGRPQARPRGP